MLTFMHETLISTPRSTNKNREKTSKINIGEKKKPSIQVPSKMKSTDFAYFTKYGP